MGDPVADELAVRRLVDTYCDAVNRRNAEDWAKVWTEDAEWHLFGRPVEGRDAVVETWKGAMGLFPFVVQLIHAVVVTLDGDRARARVYLSELAHTQKEEKLLTVGVYHDDCVREADGAWRFRRRRFDVLYQGTPDLEGRTAPVPEDGWS